MARTTGKDHARINLDIWGDDDWLDCEPDAQHLYLVLWTSPQLSYCGAGDWNPGRIASRAKGWTSEAVEIAGAKLSRDLFLIIDTDTDEFLMRSWVKHDGLWRTPNMAVSVANARADLASRTLRGVIVHEVAKIRANNPDSSSWAREAVVKMLSQKAADPATLEPYNPTVNPASNPWSNPGAKGYGQLAANPTANPGRTPATTPSPLTPSPIGGYENTEGYLHDPTSPPPPKCPEHINDPHPPNCRACGSAREAYPAWEVKQRRRNAEAHSAEARQRAEDRAQAIADCEICDEDGYDRLTLCDHDPDTAERAKRGIALVRESLPKRAAQ